MTCVTEQNQECLDMWLHNHKTLFPPLLYMRCKEMVGKCFLGMTNIQTNFQTYTTISNHIFQTSHEHGYLMEIDGNYFTLFSLWWYPFMNALQVKRVYIYMVTCYHVLTGPVWFGLVGMISMWAMFYTCKCWTELFAGFDQRVLIARMFTLGLWLMSLEQN